MAETAEKKQGNEVAVIQPTAVSAEIMRMDMIVMLAFTLVLTAMAWFGSSISRLEGTGLLAAYGLYVANLFVGWV